MRILLNYNKMEAAYLPVFQYYARKLGYEVISNILELNFRRASSQSWSS